MAALHCFSIFEAQCAIAQHLNQRDLFACVRICRAARDAFLPSLWRTLDLDLLADFLRHPHKREVFAEALHKYGALIRTLSCHNTVECQQQPHLLDLLRQVVPVVCQSLTHLQLTIPESEESQQWHLDLFQNNPTLTSISLCHVEWLEPLIPTLLAHTSCLRQLSLSFVDYIYWSPILTIIGQCPQLDSLKIGGYKALSSASNPIVMPPWPQPTKIRHLSLMFAAAGSVLFHILQACPQLTYLEVEVKRTLVREFCLALQTAPISLKHLALCHDISGSDKELAAILSAVPASQLTSVYIEGCRAGGHTLRAIVDHQGASLEALTVRSLRSIPSESVAYILSQCRQLREIEIHNLRDHPEHVSPSTLLLTEWVCQNLEVFRIPLFLNDLNIMDAGGHANTTKEQVLNRLGTFDKLRDVCLTCQCGISVVL